MDTDELTEMAYEIIVRAEQILDVLKAEIGASSARYNSEDAFLEGTLNHIDRTIKDPEFYLDYWDYYDEIDSTKFKTELEGLRNFTIKVIETPLSERGEKPY